MSDELWKLDATAQAELIRRGELHAKELVASTLARIEALDPQLGALVYRDADAALAQAESAGSGVFGGVPFLVKDLLSYPGLPCSYGSRLFASMGHRPQETLPYHAAIQDSGLVCLGVSASSELGLLGSTETLAHGVTRNPWALDRSAGGSSGGAAAAVAAGLVPMAHASDGGGSIRGPAALCGLFGFKPSAGRCLSAQPAPTEFGALVSEHVVTRSVRDSWAFLLATQRSGASATLPPLEARAQPPSRPLRIAAYTNTLMGAPAPAPGRSAVEATAKLCTALGHQVEFIEAPPALGPDISQAFFTMAGAFVKGLEDQLAPLLGGGLGGGLGPEHMEAFTLWLRDAFVQGQPRGLELARENLAKVRRLGLEFLDAYDAYLCPTIGVETPSLGYLAPNLDPQLLLRRTEALAGFTPLHNIVGACAMSLPLGADAQGLPVGVHFAASPGQDARLFALAFELEAAAPWADRWPTFALEHSPTASSSPRARSVAES